MKEKLLDKDTIDAYHMYVQSEIRQDLNSIALGPGRLPTRAAQGLTVFGFCCLLVGILLVGLRMQHVYFWDWDVQFVGPFFFILFLICLGGATYLVIIASRRANRFRRELYFRPLGDYGIQAVHKDDLLYEHEMKHDLKSGTTPHKTVMPRSDAYSMVNVSNQVNVFNQMNVSKEKRSGHHNQGYRHGPSDPHRRPPHPDDRRRGPPSDGRRGPPPDDRDRRRPPEGRRGPPPEDHRRGRGPPPGDYRRGPPDDSRRGPPPDDSRRGPPPDNYRRGPPPDNYRRGPPPVDYRRGPPPDDYRQGPPADDRREGRRSPPPEGFRGPPPEGRRGPPPGGYRDDERRGPPPDRQGPDDHRGPPPDRRGSPDDRHGPPPGDRRPRGVPHFKERSPDDDVGKVRLDDNKESESEL